MSRHLRVLVVGEGLIGTALANRLQQSGHQTIRTSRRSGAGDAFLNLDLATPEGWPDLPDADAVVLCAAVTRLADCDADPEGSARVNVAGCTELSRRMADRGAHVVLLSTDKVFDGSRARRRRDEPVCPATVYGRQKATAESGVLGAGERTAVLRLSKVLAQDVPLIEVWRRDLSMGRTITPYRNMFCAPVTVELVVREAVALLKQGRAGVFHCSGAKEYSYFDLALTLAERWGSEPDLIAPVEAFLPASHRPHHSTLDMSLEQALFDISAPNLNDVVDQIA